MNSTLEPDWPEELERQGSEPVVRRTQALDRNL